MKLLNYLTMATHVLDNRPCQTVLVFLIQSKHFRYQGIYMSQGYLSISTLFRRAEEREKCKILANSHPVQHSYEQ